MIITLHNRGSIQHPRYVLMNSYGWCWDDEGQEFVEKGGTLYHDVNPAMLRMRELMLEDFEGQPVRTFRAPVYLELHTTEEIKQSVIEDWLLRCTRFILHSDQYGLGPVNNSLGLVSVNWGELQEISPEEQP